MYWPRCQLTEQEQKRWALYEDPEKPMRGVLYRAYPAELTCTQVSPEDSENVQISRRARIFAMTASGDVHNMEITIQDSVGEQYTMGFHPISNLLMGMNVDPRGLNIFNADTDGPKRLSLGLVFGQAFCLAPKVFNPNILLPSNQTLVVKGRPLNPIRQLTAFDAETPPYEQVFVSITFHVWEFQ